jgi:hypothetical protein
MFKRWLLGTTTALVMMLSPFAASAEVKDIVVTYKDDITTLNYARQDMFAYVLYFNQKFNEHEGRILQKTTTDLIDLALGLNGSYYLPYQLFYSKEQLRKAYPRVDEFFEAKMKYDPGELFSNKFYEKYAK